MIKIIVQKIKNKKNGEIGEIFGSPDWKKKKALLELSLGRELKTDILLIKQLKVPAPSSSKAAV